MLLCFCVFGTPGDVCGAANGVDAVMILWCREWYWCGDHFCGLLKIRGCSTILKGSNFGVQCVLQDGIIDPKTFVWFRREIDACGEKNLEEVPFLLDLARMAVGALRICFNDPSLLAQIWYVDSASQCRPRS